VNWARLSALAAFVLFVLAALPATALPAGWRAWEIPGGMAALALALVLALG
jgi:hypothetical protein